MQIPLPLPDLHRTGIRYDCRYRRYAHGLVHINIKVVHVEHPVGQCQTEQRIKLNALGHRKQIVKIHVQIQHAYIVILEEIVERRLYTDRIGNIVLILDTQPDTSISVP